MEIRLQALLQLGSIFLFLLFLPHLSPLANLGITPPERYGEFELQVDGLFMAVIKNASDGSIHPEIERTEWASVRGFDRHLDAPFSLEALEEVVLPPRSYAIAVADAQEDAARFARLPDGRRFEVKRLMLLTSGEQSLSALGIVCLLIGTGYLCFRSAEYFRTAREDSGATKPASLIVGLD